MHSTRTTNPELAAGLRRLIAAASAALLAFCAVSGPAYSQEPGGEPDVPVVRDETDATQPVGDPPPAEGEVEDVIQPEPGDEELPRIDDRSEDKKAEDRVRREYKARRKLMIERYEQVRAYYWQALKSHRAKRYATAIKWCDKALRIDPGNLSVQKLKYLSERSRQSHTLALEDERDKFRIEDRIADIERESRFPDQLPPLPRPNVLLREHAPKSQAMRRMNEMLNQPVSMNFIDADLDYVLQMLFKISGVDILAEQSVVADKTLTLHVEAVPLKDILEFIKRNYEGIDYTVTENAVWLVSPEKPRLIPRLYPLSRGLVSASSFSSGVRSSSRPGVGGGSSSNPLGNLAGTSAADLSRALSGMMGNNRSSRQPNSGSGGSSRGGAGGQGNNESHLEGVLKWIETWETEWPIGSKWWMDRQTNTLMVLTTPQMHDHVEEVLDIMDTVPLQVLIKTKFIEVLSDDLKEFGVSSLNFLEQGSHVLVEPTTLTPGLPEGVTAGTSGMGGAESGLAVNFANALSNTSQIMGVLNALDKKQRTRVLSAPQIIAMNNTTASIDISKSFSYASQYRSTNGTVVNNNTSISVPNAMVPSQFEDISVGFFVEFVPSIGRDHKNIVLDLHARVDEVVGNIEDFQSIPIIVPSSTDPNNPNPAIPSSGGTQAVQRPIVDGREFQTRLVVEDGGTVVIGGLLKNFNETVRRQVPILGQIPILGLLFRYSKETQKQSNLIIVVEAHIVTPSGQYYASEEEKSTEGMSEVRSFSSKPVSREWIPDLAPEITNSLLPEDLD